MQDFFHQPHFGINILGTRNYGEPMMAWGTQYFTPHWSRRIAHLAWKKLGCRPFGNPKICQCWRLTFFHHPQSTHVFTIHEQHFFVVSLVNLFFFPVKTMGGSIHSWKERDFGSMFYIIKLYQAIVVVIEGSVYRFWVNLHGKRGKIHHFGPIRNTSSFYWFPIFSRHLLAYRSVQCRPLRPWRVDLFG